jgi:ABC-2 type transport system ATP-binding protein
MLDIHQNGASSASDQTGTEPESDVIVATYGLRKLYGDFAAVDDIDLRVHAGEVFGLLGPNGAGKSTTIKMLVTLLPPTEGHATVGGYDVVKEADEVRRLLGYVPQALSADGTLTGFENLMVFAKLYDVPHKEQKPRVEEALEFMGLSDAANRLVNQYSGGMIRKLEIGQTLIHRPRVLFLDEPTIGLDPVARRNVWKHLDDLRRQYGTTLFLTTHYMEEAEELCTRIAIMNRGKVSALNTPEGLIEGVGRPEATLEDAFAHYTGADLGEDTGGDWRNARSSRRTARRLG